MIEALAAASFTYARGGYEVIFDGILGPWFLAPFRARAAEGVAFHYVVLRTGREEALARVMARDGADNIDAAPSPACGISSPIWASSRSMRCRPTG